MPPLPRDVVVLSDDQFNKLVELLTPGYELAKAYIGQMQADRARHVPDESQSGGQPTGNPNVAHSAVASGHPPHSAGDPSQSGGQPS